MPGVLQQLVNCFLKASGGSLSFRHILAISSKMVGLVGLVGLVRLVKMLAWKRCYVFFRILGCAGTAGQLPPEGIWRNYHVLTVLKKEVFTENTIQLVRKSR